MLTRPEFAVLLAYAKIALQQDLVESDVPNDDYLARELKRYFPKRMADSYGEEIEQHRLKREIIATQLANSIINRGGPGFVARLQSETGATPAQIAAAFAVARDSFDFTYYNQAIDRLDNRIANALQTRLYLEVQSLLQRAVQWFLRNTELGSGLNEIVSQYRQGIDALKGSLREYLPPSAADAMDKRAEELKKAGLPEELARDIASLGHLQRATDIVQVAKECGTTPALAARVLYASAAEFNLDQIIAQSAELVARDFFERLAINRMVDQVFLAHRGISRRALEQHGAEDDPWAVWVEAHSERVEKVARTISELMSEKPFDLAKLSVAQGLLSDLALARQ
jgi:glutamate dehydrogenase